MGIHGLTSFIDDNPQLLHDLCLHDTRVVIDGNNLYHFLYYYCNVPHEFGGNYDHFTLKVKSIFSTMHACNIRPIIVFDGGYDVEGRKLKTTLFRAKQRILKALSISQGGQGRILPILAHEVFKKTLDSIGVPHVTCSFEADNEIATLANLWNCPVMSNDSDFFVYDLKAGFILLDYTNFSCSCDKDPNTGKTSKYLLVQLYHIDRFVETFESLDKSFLPVLAVLLGNDFVESNVFANFLAKLQYPTSKKKKKLSCRKKHVQIVAILNWLAEVENTEEAVEQIVASVSDEHKAKVTRVIQQSMVTYRVAEKFDYFNLQEFFERNRRAAASLCTEKVKAFGGSSLPVWFVTALRCGELPPFLQNAVILHRIVHLTQVENMKATSSHVSSLHLRQVMYGILMKNNQSFSNTPFAFRSSKETCIEEYTRERKDLKKCLITPNYSLPEYGPLPGLTEIPNLSREKGIKIVLEALSVPFSLIDRFSPDMKLIAAAIVYWVVNADPKLTVHHLEAMLVCIIFLHSKVKVRKTEAAAKSLSAETSEVQHEQSAFNVKECCRAATKDELDFVDRSLKKYHTQMPIINNVNYIESEITHGLSQFQSCLLDAMTLNQLLQCPFPNPKLHCLFNGVFLYNFCRELHLRKDSRLFIMEMLGRKSTMAELYEGMLASITEHIGPSPFLEPAAHRKKNRKRKKRKTAKGSTVVLKGCDSEGEVVEQDQQDSLIAACDLENRFSCLMNV